MFVTNDIVSHIPVHALRLLYYRRIMKFKIAKTARIFRGCSFDAPRGLIVAEHSVINRGCRIDTRGGVRIGSNVSISEGVILLTAQHDPESDTFATTKSGIEVGDYSFIGTSAIVMPGRSIDRGGILGAGSILTKNIGEDQIWAGNPAKYIRDRLGTKNYQAHYVRHFH